MAFYSDRLRITVLGSGTSMGVPTIGCHCEVCSSNDPRDNRLRPSILIRYGGRNVLIDTTPDFRTQALRAKINRLDAILFTHEHADHIMGLDDVHSIYSAWNSIHCACCTAAARCTVIVSARPPISPTTARFHLNRWSGYAAWTCFSSMRCGTSRILRIPPWSGPWPTPNSLIRA